MNTSRRCQHDSCNCRPTDFLPYRREPEEKANKKRGVPAPTPLSTPSKETDNNPRYFQFLSQAQKNLFSNYSSSTKATLASIDDMEMVRPYLTLIQNLEMVTEEKSHNRKDQKKKREKITALQKEIAQFTKEHTCKESQGQGFIPIDTYLNSPLLGKQRSNDVTITANLTNMRERAQKLNERLMAELTQRNLLMQTANKKKEQVPFTPPPVHSISRAFAKKKPSVPAPAPVPVPAPAPVTPAPDGEAMNIDDDL